MNHFPVSLSDNPGFALLSHKPPVYAVVFVHGFLGHPRATWLDFQNLAGGRPEWIASDLFFYAYKSQDQVPVLAQGLENFVARLAAGREGQVASLYFQAPSLASANLLNASPYAQANRGQAPYEKLILVGHSTGALVIREMIRSRIARVEGKPVGQPKAKVDRSDEFLLLSTLRFFAPAHLGAMVSGKLGIVQSIPLIDRFLAGYFRSNALYQNLQPTSPTVASLKSATEGFAEKYEWPALRAISMFGVHEEIVFVGHYKNDAEDVLVPNRNHTSVCKPHREYLDPLRFIEEGYAATAGRGQDNANR